MVTIYDFPHKIWLFGVKLWNIFDFQVFFYYFQVVFIASPHCTNTAWLTGYLIGIKMTNKSNKAYCSNPEVVRICPRTCNACPDQIRACNDQSIYCPMYRNRCGEAEILNLCAFTCGSCSAPPQTIEWSRATAPPVVETTVELATTVVATTVAAGNRVVHISAVATVQCVSWRQMILPASSHLRITLF